MMRTPRLNRDYNLPLIAYQIGQAAADLGAQAVAAHEAGKKAQATRLADYLVQLEEGLVGPGQPEDAGLLKANTTNPQDKTYLNQVEQQVRNVARAAVELARAAGVQETQRRQDLATRVGELRSFLAANVPKSWTLVPGGPEFRGAKTDVAAGGVEPKGGR
ncbi:MAG: hypothetical protein IRY99_12565 [Isosphaeraceae bacterium]|nr:hypothetical protein [Isosphaeraceae bacterium]